jgi:hypothetical protein
MELFSFRNRILVGIGLFLGLVVLLVILSFTPKRSITLPPSLPTISDTYQKAFSGISPETPVSSLSRLPGFKDKKQITKDTTAFLYTSPLLARDNVVHVQNNKISYTSQVTIDASYKHPSLKQYLSRYGTPDKTFMGSVLFGEFAKTYVYASKGVAFTGSTDTDEVFLFQTFLPTTLTAYTTQYGQDITNHENHVEKVDPKAEAVRLLKLKLPYFGENFALTYDGAEYKTTVLLKNDDTGQAEFDKFLLDNNIPSRSWINNLTQINL